MDDFTFVSTHADKRIGSDFEDLVSAKVADIDVSLTRTLRAKHPELNLTTVANVPLLQFAAMGHATAEMDTESDTVFRWRGWMAQSARGSQGAVADAVFFAKYHYKWGDEDYILYFVRLGMTALQYVLKEPGDGESQVSHCAKTDSLIKAVAEALSGDPLKFIYVYDGYWTRSSALYDEVQKASWDNVILSDKTKRALTKVSSDFFDSREQYEKYGVAWKRGLIWYGPAGNGKTVSIKALMHDLQKRNPTVPTLYVKSAHYTYNIGQVFQLARIMAPCTLVLEDIETIVNRDTRSYFFNEVDGLENNNGILMVATTNYLDRLDPGLSKRPSRFDRKYLFPKPAKSERVQYAKYWRQKILKKTNDIDFPEMLCPAIADITDDFSFAYMQEAFVATLLAIARGDTDESDDELMSAEDTLEKWTRNPERPSEVIPKRRTELVWASGTYRLDYTSDEKTKRDDRDDRLNRYRFWRVIKEQVRALRDDMHSGMISQDAALGQRLLDELTALRVSQPASVNPQDKKPKDPSFEMPGGGASKVGRPSSLFTRYWEPEVSVGGQSWWLEGEQNCDFNGRTGSSYGFLAKDV